MAIPEPLRNPLHFCISAYSGERDVVRQYLAEGWDPNTLADADTCPLAHAALGGSLETVEDLLTAGADPNGAALVGFTPLMGAVKAGRTDIMQVLLDAGADVVVNDREREDPDVWTVAAWAAWHGHNVLLRVAAEAGADLDAEVEHEGMIAPPLIFAVEAGHLEAVKILVEAGADVNKIGYRGRPSLQGPALLFAEAAGRKDIYDYLASRTKAE